MQELFEQPDSRVCLEESDSQLLALQIVMALWPLTGIAKIKLP